MSNAFVQIAYVELPAVENSVELELTNPVAEGDILIFGISYLDVTSVASMVDDMGNVWKNMSGGIDNPNGSFRMDAFYCFAKSAAASLTLICTLEGTTQIKAAALAEYSGQTGLLDDILAFNNSLTNNIVIGTLTAVAHNIIIAFGATQSSAAYTAPSDFTLRTPSGAGNHIALIDNLDSSAGANPVSIGLGAIDWWVGITALFGSAAIARSISAIGTQVFLTGQRVLPIEKEEL